MDENLQENTNDLPVDLLNRMGISLDDLKTDQPAEESNVESPKTPEGANDAESVIKELDDNPSEEVGESEDQEQVEDVESTPEQSDDFLNIIHNGESKILNKEDTIKYAQMGFDYTQKMQALSEERKQAEAEYLRSVEQLENHYKGFDEEIKTKRAWDLCIDNIKENDPDLYERIEDTFKDFNRQMNNPYVNKQIEMMNKKIEELTKVAQLTENQNIIKKYETELNDLKQEVAPSITKLNLNVNWDKVKDAWKNSSMSVKQAFFQVYGPDIMTLYNSKSKIEETKKKIVPKSPTPTNRAKAIKGSAKPSLDLSKDYMELVNDILKGSY